ncbi:MAG: aldehyde dehydrogenase family protein, partial [Acidobacteriota bacterium]
MIHIENYIGGQLVKPGSGAYLDNFDPSTGAVYSYIPNSSSTDVDRAVSAAAGAFPDWSRRSPEHRHDAIMRLVRLIERDIDELAAAESLDNGKPVSLARSVDIPRAALNFKFYA